MEAVSGAFKEHKKAKTSIGDKHRNTKKPPEKQHDSVLSIIRDPRIQAKLRIRDAVDGYEREADAVAGRVMAMPETTGGDEPLPGKATAPSVQRSSSTSGPAAESQPENGMQLKAGEEPEGELSESDEQTVLERAVTAADLNESRFNSGGAVLYESTKQFYESRFGRDLSAVRVHSGGIADVYCDRLSAHAFTYANHIWLSRQVSARPSFVMAHELAHVIQQTQPKPLDRPSTRSVETFGTQAPRRLQRLPFWVPIQRGKVMSGTAIHKELLGAVDGKNKVEIEAPVPNAIRSDWGLGLQGFADLYRASSRVGVFFQPRSGLAVGNQTGDLRYTRPAKPAKAGKNPKPVAKAGGISNITGGPKSIELGELKPAALTELTKGKDQLDNYKKGFKDTAELTNAWADSEGKSDRWNPNPAIRLPDSAVKVAAEHDPSNKKSGNRDLALADVDETSSATKSKETVKYSVKELFLPKPWLGQQIKGRLYMEPFGQGLWMYYARPDDFSKALDVPKFKREEKQAYMKVAEQVQDEVIGNLKRGPKRIKLIQKPPSERRFIAPNKMPSKGLRLKRKTSKMKDDFNLKTWTEKRKQLAGQIRGKGVANIKSKETKAIKKLEFLQLAMEAEESISPKAKAKTSHLPTAKSMKEKIVTGSGKEKVTKRISLDELFGWLKRWTSRPVDVLGKLRAKFGKPFVKAVNKLHDLKERVKEKLKSAFKSKSSGKGRGYAKLALKAIGTALLQIGELIVPHTVGLIMAAISTGVKKKLEKEFGFSKEEFIAQAKDDFPQVKALEKEVGEYVKSGKDYAKSIAEDYATELDAVKELAEMGKSLAPIIEAAMIIANCATPPGWGCLKLLAQEMIKSKVDLVLQSCYVRLKIARSVEDTDFIRTLPEKLGQLALEKLHELAPPPLKDIFSEKIVQEPFEKINEDEILCVKLSFGLGGGKVVPTPGGKQPRGKKGIPPEQMQKKLKGAEAMTELKNTLGDQGAVELAEALEKYGIPEKQGISAEQWKKLADSMKSLDGRQSIKEYNGKKRKPGHKAGTDVDIDQFLQEVDDVVAKERGKQIDREITAGVVESKTGVKVTQAQLDEIKKVLKQSGWSVEKIKRIMEMLKTGKKIPVDEFIKQLQLLRKIPIDLLAKSGISVNIEQMKELIRFLNEVGWSEEKIKTIVATLRTEQKMTFNDLMKALRSIKDRIEKAKADVVGKGAQVGPAKPKAKGSPGGGLVPLTPGEGSPDYCGSPFVLCRRIWVDKDGNLIKIGPIEIGPQQMEKPGAMPGEKEQIEVPGAKIRF